MLFKSRRFKKTDQLALWGVGRGGNLDNSYFSGTLPVGKSAWANLAGYFYSGTSTWANLLGGVSTIWTKFKKSLFLVPTKDSWSKRGKRAVAYITDGQL